MKHGLIALAVLTLLAAPGQAPAHAASLAWEMTLDEKEAFLARTLETSPTLDQLFIEIDRWSPGFGGLFLDPNGGPAIYVMDAAEEENARLAGAALLAAKGLPPARAQVLSGNFSFSELAGWHRKLTSLLEIPGVVLTDVDEAANRVRVGIERPETRFDVEAELIRLGVPLEAVHIRITEPIFFTKSLRNKFRPFVGGVQITFDCSPEERYACTLGFPAISRADVKGFVTNSHCSCNQGTEDGAAYSQPFPRGSRKRIIGHEITDAGYFTGPGCPVGRRCRFSDSAFAKKKNKVEFRLGSIARTRMPGSLLIFSRNGRFNIVSEDPGVLVGETLNKMGRTTGWTQGPVSSTCETINVSGTDITLLCQTTVRAGVSPGDSGSPVFRITTGSDVSLYGILWGGDYRGTRFVYSPLQNIQMIGELGTLRTCRPKAGC